VGLAVVMDAVTALLYEGLQISLQREAWWGGFSITSAGT
jgi:hypothetical protein